MKRKRRVRRRGHGMEASWGWRGEEVTIIIKFETISYVSLLKIDIYHLVVGSTVKEL